MSTKQTKGEKQAELATPATNEKEVSVKPEPTSEKLEQLKKAKSDAMAKAAASQIEGNDKEAEQTRESTAVW